MERTIKRAFRFALSACLISLLTACGGNKTSNTEVTPSIESSAYVHKKEAYKVACVGDSLTAGHMWANQAYPVYLDEYLKATYPDINYEVKNCGVNGISITGYGGSWKNPNMRYAKQSIYKETINSYLSEIH